MRTQALLARHCGLRASPRHVRRHRRCGHGTDRPADRGRHRRSGRDGRDARHARGGRHAPPRRQRGRRRRHGGRGTRRHRALLVRDRRRRLPAPPDRRRRRHDRRPSREGSGGDAARLLLGDRRPARVQRRALQRPVRRRPRHGRGLGPRARPLRDDLAGRGAASRRSGLAREGFVIDQVFFDQTLANADWFDDVPASAALFLDADGTPKDVGTVFRNPDLARAYERIAHLGAKGFYRGAIADALSETVQHPPVAPTANHVWRSGLMTMRDLHGYVAPEREPTRVGYRGLDVWGMGPPSSGGSTVGEALNILEGYPLATQTRERQLHLFLEASRFSFADRGRVPRRPRLRQRAAARAPLGRLRRHAAVADHGNGGDEPGRCRATPGRSTAAWGRCSRPRRRTSSRRRRRTSAPRTASATSSRTRSRSSRPAVRGSSSPAGASCSTTS